MTLGLIPREQHILEPQAGPPQPLRAGTGLRPLRGAPGRAGRLGGGRPRTPPPAPGRRATSVHTRRHRGTARFIRGFERAFRFVLSSNKRILATAPSRVRGPRGAFGAAQPPGAGRGSRGRQDVGCRREARSPWSAGRGAASLAEAFRPYGGPTPRRAWLGFPGLCRWRPHKDGIHGEALNSLRNEAGFK